MSEQQSMWIWTVVMVDGEIPTNGISASRFDTVPYQRAENRIDSMFTNLDGEVVVEFSIAAPTRTDAIAKAQVLYDRDVPDDMKN